MSLTDEERNTIVKYELEKARTTLCEVDALIENNLWTELPTDCITLSFTL